MSVGKSIPRVDAYEKACGRAMYTDDLAPANALVAKVVRSTIANGLVKSIDTSKAQSLPGVVKVFTCFDVPKTPFPTAGHPWSCDEGHRDVADRLLLNRRVRIYGDDIAVVVAQDEVAAARAARLVQVEYEQYPALTDVDAALASDNILHEEFPGNLLCHSSHNIGDEDFETAASDEGLIRLCKTYHTQVVQHCHIEVPICYAHMEKDRVVVVSSTQIPHIVRRVIHQATGLSFGKIKVIKPYIGGGFGNKQEVLYEPLCAWLATQLCGSTVKLELSREETFACTRTRHAIRFTLNAAVNKQGRLIARKAVAHSNQGGYASHGHAIVANAATAHHMLYQDEKSHRFDAYTVYTNLPSAGAMRGYGIPQVSFASESHMDDLALLLGMDPIDFRSKNHMKLGYVDPHTGIACHSNGLAECMQKGREYIRWDEKRKAYQNEQGALRRGVGMSVFAYKTGVWPIALETASCRIVLNQDGSVQVQMGATEIGQGADTVFTQMAAQSIGISLDDVHIISSQDTDVTPFDTGAYASRQTYVSGHALKQTAEIFKQKLLDYAAELLGKTAQELNVENSQITEKASGKPLCPLSEVAMQAFYSTTHNVHITAESTYHCERNAYSFGACFAEIEVDIPLGKVEVLNIINVHDSGILINPQLAEAQVHGGMSMGLGYALSEELLFSADAKPLNANLLDYKLPTSMDTPELCADFVQTNDITGPYGNKSLGEPPTIPAAPAIRNAILHATGVAVDSLPLSPQRLVEAFTQAGLITPASEQKEGGANV